MVRVVFATSSGGTGVLACHYGVAQTMTARTSPLMVRVFTTVPVPVVVQSRSSLLRLLVTYG